MDHEDMKRLRDQIAIEHFTRQQLHDLLGSVVNRVCRLDQPELKQVRFDLCDALDAFADANQKIDARTEAIANDTDLARIARHCGAV